MRKKPVHGDCHGDQLENRDRHRHGDGAIGPGPAAARTVTVTRTAITEYRECNSKASDVPRPARGPGFSGTERTAQLRARAWQETTIERRGETITYSLRRVPALRVQLIMYQDRVSLARVTALATRDMGSLPSAAAAATFFFLACPAPPLASRLRRAHPALRDAAASAADLSAQLPPRRRRRRARSSWAPLRRARSTSACGERWSPSPARAARSSSAARWPTPASARGTAAWAPPWLRAAPSSTPEAGRPAGAVDGSARCRRPAGGKLRAVGTGAGVAPLYTPRRAAPTA
jgi:hypothetical protein